MLRIYQSGDFPAYLSGYVDDSVVYVIVGNFHRELESFVSQLLTWNNNLNGEIFEVDHEHVAVIKWIT